MPDALNLATVYQQLDAQCQRHDYAGWDPFDGLNSRLFQLSPLSRSKWMRLAWLQFHKRAPVNFRPLLGIPRVHNAKALSLFLRSYLLAGDSNRARHCLNLMLTQRCDEPQWGQAAWGYPFDWQAKAFFVSKETPNVICTNYALLALQAAEDKELIKDSTPYLQAAAEFILTHLWRSNAEGEYIAYVPGADALVHNANLWGASILIAAHERTQEARYLTHAEQAIHTSLTAQHEDGKWRYGTMAHHQFIDGFHTGYNLEALHRINQHLGREDIARAIEKGIAYYREHFFGEDRLAHYYHDNPYPIDPHSAAQAIMTFNQIQPESSREFQHAILTAICQRCWDGKHHYFHYQHWQRYQNRNNYIRWTQAWMHLALKQFLSKGG